MGTKIIEILKKLEEKKYEDTTESV